MSAESAVSFGPRSLPAVDRTRCLAARDARSKLAVVDSPFSSGTIRDSDHRLIATTRSRLSPVPDPDYSCDTCSHETSPKHFPFSMSADTSFFISHVLFYLIYRSSENYVQVDTFLRGIMYIHTFLIIGIALVPFVQGVQVISLKLCTCTCTRAKLPRIINGNNDLARKLVVMSAHARARSVMTCVRSVLNRFVN